MESVLTVDETCKGSQVTWISIKDEELMSTVGGYPEGVGILGIWVELGGVRCGIFSKVISLDRGWVVVGMD